MSFIDQLPFFYWEDNNIKSIQDAFENESNIKKDKLEDTLLQLNVDTATWALDVWENMLGIRAKTSNYEIRRKNIKAKLRGRGTTTKQQLISITNSYSNSEVDLDEYPAEYYFVICIILNSITEEEYAELFEIIESIKPVHLESIYNWMVKERYRLGMAMSTFDLEIITVYPGEGDLYGLVDAEGYKLKDRQGYSVKVSG